MCNPRRVRVQATRKIAEAWRTEIQQAATARGDISSEARLVQPIDDLLPRQARLAFEQAMSRSADWYWVDGGYRLNVPGGTVSYRPDTGDLTIVVVLSEAIEAVGSASLELAGTVTDEVQATASGTYYADGYRGNHRAAASQRATAAAEAKLDKLAEERRAALVEQAEEAARHELGRRTGEAAAQARENAEQQLTLKGQQLQPALDHRADEKLAAVQSETLKGIFALVASGYSAALQQYATQHGENLQVEESGGVIEIQFELEG